MLSTWGRGEETTNKKSSHIMSKTNALKWGLFLLYGLSLLTDFYHSVKGTSAAIVKPTSYEWTVPKIQGGPSAREPELS